MSKITNRFTHWWNLLPYKFIYTKFQIASQLCENRNRINNFQGPSLFVANVVCSLATYFSYIFMCKNYDLIGMTYLSRWFLTKDVLQGCRITNVLKAFLMKYNSYHLERMTIAMIVRLVYPIIKNTAIQIFFSIRF